MFVIIVASPLFIYQSEKSRTGKVEFVKNGDLDETDSIKLIEVIDGKDEPFLFGFNETSRNEAYFLKDSVEIRLVAGFLGGYNLQLKIHGDEFSSTLHEYNCTWHEELKIKQLSLKLEDMKMTDDGRLVGAIDCVAFHTSQWRRERVEKVKIKGTFEMKLVDVSKIKFE